MITATEHAERQAVKRDLPMAAVLFLVNEKLKGRDRDAESCAVFLVERDYHSGDLMGGNGNQVWAIVRAGEIVTVMFRRDDNPPTPAKLRVRKVVW